MGISLLHRKDQLILTTIDIIDELGIQKLTTREIAKRQEVSEATLFRHFKNKNELLIAVLEYFIQYDEDILQSAKMLKLKPTEALKFLMNSYAEYYENYPAITAITQIFDVLRYEEELSEKVKDIQKKRTAILSQLMKAAQNAGEFTKNVDSELVAVMISGSFRELCFNWRLEQGKFSLREKAILSLEMILNAFQ